MKTATHLFFWECLLLVLLGSTGGGSPGVLRAKVQQPAASPMHGFKALVFSKTAGYRHASIPDGITAIRALGDEHKFDVDATEDASVFASDSLGQYRVVIFLSTTGNVLNEEQQDGFEQYVQAGGGYVGVHAAADTEYDWAWYGDLVGAYFKSHPSIQNATVTVADHQHPSTKRLPDRWTRTDEWYNFRTNPRGDVHVLATLNEDTYSGGENGNDHPIAWCQPYRGGRSWYTAGGHTSASFSDALFRDHLLGGIRYAAGEAGDGTCSVSSESNFGKSILDDNPTNPVGLAVAPDGRVFYIERGGALNVYLPAPESRTVTAGELDVYNGQEDGLIGIALDPDFAGNNQLYLYYSPAGSESKQNLSRFTVSDNSLDMDSEEVLMEVDTQRRQCCHAGGSLAFGPDGNLYLATGDDTNPFASDGYAPLDERKGRAFWDSQRSAGNKYDLRGKILRITPQPDGSYTIPAGNLFAKDGSEGKPEIYVMGDRNPYRISVDQETGWLYWGEVGPDAGNADPHRGPQGYDEFNQAREAGNYGWPYCIADNKAYHSYDFDSGTSGAVFNCGSGPINDSPHVDGTQQLPPAQPALMWYPYGAAEDFPALGSGARTAMAGPVYHYEASRTSDVQLPAYYDDTFFIYEWSRNWIKAVKLDEQGKVLKINPFLPNWTFNRPMDMELGPNGALYVLEWGTGYEGGNDDARLSRISYLSSGQPPAPRVQADATSGSVPLTVHFSASGSYDPDGAAGTLSYAWDFEGEGTTDATTAHAAHTYSTAGTYDAQLTVTDADDNESVATVAITAGNTRPRVSIETPLDGSFYEHGATYSYEITVHDDEDGSTEEGGIACDDVVVEQAIGHNQHSHGDEQHSGCSGTFTLPSGHHGSEGANLFYVVRTRYEDAGGTNGAQSLTGRDAHVLRGPRLQAQNFSTQQGVQLENTTDTTGGGQDVGYIEDGDYLSIAPVNLESIETITYRVASAGVGGRIAVRVDSVDGATVSRVEVEPTGGWQNWISLDAPVTDPGGTHELFLVFLNEQGGGGLFNVNWLQFAPTRETSATPTGEPPSQYVLHGNVPNPVGAAGTTIRYTLPEAATVRLAVFDVMGRRVRTLVARRQQPGTKAVQLEASGLPAGAYFYRLSAGSFSKTRKMLIVR